MNHFKIQLKTFKRWKEKYDEMGRYWCMTKVVYIRQYEIKIGSAHQVTEVKINKKIFDFLKT